MMFPVNQVGKDSFLNEELRRISNCPEVYSPQEGEQAPNVQL